MLAGGLLSPRGHNGGITAVSSDKSVTGGSEGNNTYNLHTRMRASRRVNASNPEHPLRETFESTQPHLVKIQSEMLALKKELIAQGALFKGPNVINGAIFEHPKMIELRDRFKELMRGRLNVSKETLTHPVPERDVNRRELYNRVQVGTKILDVGSGDGRRLKGLKGVDVMTLDQNVDKTIIRAPHTQCRFEGKEHPERVVTSFNSMTQIGEGAFVERDGIHVVPDLDALVRGGKSKQLQDGTFETKIKDAVFIDKPVSIPKMKLKGHSCGLNTYENMRITVQLRGLAEGEKADLKSVGRRNLPSYFVDNDMTLKTNGKLYKLHLHESGSGVLRSREENNVRHIQHNMKKNAVLDIEDFNDELILIRVVSWNGFQPFHSLALLEYFTSRVKIRIKWTDGKYRFVRPPLRVNPDEATMLVNSGVGEGVVIRKNNADYLLRHKHSIDVNKPTLENIIKELSTRGVNLIVADEVWNKFRDKNSVHELQVTPLGTPDGIKTPFGPDFRLEWVAERFVGKRLDSAEDFLKQLYMPTMERYFEFLRENGSG